MFLIKFTLKLLINRNHEKKKQKINFQQAKPRKN